MHQVRVPPHEAHYVLRCARRITAASLLLPLAGLALTASVHAQAKPGCRGVVLGVDGEPLPVGTQLQACVEWHPDPAAKKGHFAVGMQQALVGITLGEGGAFELAQELPAPWRGHVGWLRIEREAAGGARERYFAPVKTGERLRVQLQAEELLASGTVRSELGTPVRRHAFRLGLASKAPTQPGADQVLGARWELGEGVFRLYGFRADGEFLLTSFYPYKGPSGPPVPLRFGAKDVAVVMPATGHLQVKVLVPKPFPQRALFARLHDVERDKPIERWLIPGDATNIRLRPGRYQATIELSGKAIGNPIECVVEPDKTCELPPLDLRKRVHVYLIDVLDPEGQQIMPARVRILGTKGMGAGRQSLRAQGFHWPIVIASTEPKIDIEVSEFGTSFEKRILRAVDGNRRVTLQRR
jgi:hypothetical protein